MRIIITFTFLVFSYTAFSQVQDMDLDAIDIEGTIDKPDVDVPDFEPDFGKDKEKGKKVKASRENAKSKSSSKKQYTALMIEEELNREMDYYTVHSQLSSYITSKDANGNITIESLEAINLWDEPTYEIVDQSYGSQDIELDESKSEFSKMVYDVTNKSNDPKVNSLKQKSLNYFNHSQKKEQIRVFNENKYAANLPYGNPIARRSIQMHQKANNLFNQIAFRMNNGYITRFKSIDQFEATKILFYTNLQTAKRVLNPYSLDHHSIDQSGIDPEKLSTELLDTAGDILEFAAGTRSSIELTLVESWNTAKSLINYADDLIDDPTILMEYAENATKTIVKYGNIVIDDPKAAMGWAWDVIASISYEAILNSMFYNVYNQLDKLENGTPFEKGEVIGNFITGVFSVNLQVSKLAINSVRQIRKIRSKGGKYIDEFKDIMNNEDGALRLSNKVMYRNIKNRVDKFVDDVIFKIGQVETKLKSHGDDFGISDHTNIRNLQKNIKLFEDKLKAHMNDRGTIALLGTYKNSEKMKVIHYFNNKSKKNVIVRAEDNTFLSGWKLTNRQANFLMRKNHVPDLTTKEKKKLGIE